MGPFNEILSQIFRHKPNESWFSQRFSFICAFRADQAHFIFYSLKSWIIKNYRKSGWFGPNFDFDAWLRPNGVLYNTAIGGIFLILIWASFSVHIVGTYFCSTVLFEAKNLKFLDFRFCGWFGPVVFLKAF